MIGIAKHRDGGVPGFLPGEPLLVDQDADQLGHCDCRVGVVELDRHLLREVSKIGVCFQIPPNDVGDRTGCEKILLLEPELFPGQEVVIWIENLRNYFRGVLLQHRALIVAVIENSEVELLAGARLPKAEGVDGASAIPRDWHIIRDAQDCLAINPTAYRPATGTEMVLDVAIEPNRHGLLRADDFPRAAKGEPLVGTLHLISIDDVLREDSKLVADAVSKSRQPKCSQGAQKAGGQPAKAAIPPAPLPLGS